MRNAYVHERLLKATTRELGETRSRKSRHCEGYASGKGQRHSIPSKADSRSTKMLGRVLVDDHDP